MNSISGTESRKVTVIRLSAIYRMVNGVERICPKTLATKQSDPFNQQYARLGKGTDVGGLIDLKKTL